MGLDACVYRSRTHLPFDPDAVGAVLDASTGEYYFPNPAVEALREAEFPRDTRIAVQKRIGDIASVALLRNKIKEVLDQDSVILSKVLYSGVHGGDSISLSVVPHLQKELVTLRRGAEVRSDDHLMQFVADMEELTTAAISEGNPIVF